MKGFGRLIVTAGLLACLWDGSVQAAQTPVVSARSPVALPALTTPLESSSTVKSPSVVSTPAAKKYIDAAPFAKAHSLNNSNAFAKSLCDKAGFHCMHVPPGATWVDLFPNYYQRQIMMRLNRINVALSYKNWLVEPNDLANVKYMSLSPMPQERKPKGHKLLVIDLSKFAFGVYDKQGHLIYWGPASGGTKVCIEGTGSCLSAQGDFRIFKKKGPDCISHTFPLKTKGGAPMPYCMFYHKGYAIHSSTLSGPFNHSQGCIRLFYDDAYWLNTQFAKVGTEVIVIR